jgi:hypothetical protein
MRVLWAVLLAAVSLFAHVGSPDIFYEGEAGPYRLLVTIRPPEVVPGVAVIEVRSASPEVDRVRIVPLRLGTTAPQFAPTPDVTERSKDDPQFFTGTLWLMGSGSWQVRIEAEGTAGAGQLAVPVPALSQRTLTMQRNMGLILAALAVLLCAGIISIVGAGMREAQLEPGDAPAAGRFRRARMAMGFTALIVAVVLWLGNLWWDSEAGWYRRYVFKPLELQAGLENGNRLRLRLNDPGWLNRRVDDLLPDHNHLMHLYLMRVPDMDLVWHLHPELLDAGLFEQFLPDMPPGRYALFGDIVHANGLPETVTAEIDLPRVDGRPLQGDDSSGSGPPLGEADYNRTVATLPDGYRMVWVRPAARLSPRQPAAFRFRLEDPAGNPARQMELYMGMQGHAAFVRDDRSVFAHVHPSGSVPMAALTLTGAGDPHAGHAMTMDLPPQVSFPYGFPRAGSYRIYVQVKRAGRVQTGVFDARVEN